MNVNKKLKTRILEAQSKSRTPIYMPTLIEKSPQYFVERLLYPEFMYNHNSLLVHKVLNKTESNCSINMESKEWEVRFGKERDGPLDALEVMSLLKMCKREDILIKNMRSKNEYSSIEFQTFLVNDQTLHQSVTIIDNQCPPMIDINKMSDKHIKIKRISNAKLESITSNTDSEKRSDDSNINFVNVKAPNNFHNVLTKNSQSLRYNKIINYEKRNDYQEVHLYNQPENQYRIFKLPKFNTNPNNEDKTDRFYAYNYISNYKDVEKPSQYSQLIYNNRYVEENKRKLSDKPQKDNTHNVYINNYTGTPKTQAYSWSIKKNEVIPGNNKYQNCKRDNFIEKVISKAEIRKISQVKKDDNSKIILKGNEEILLNDIRYKAYDLDVIRNSKINKQNNTSMYVENRSHEPFNINSPSNKFIKNLIKYTD